MAKNKLNKDDKKQLAYIIADFIYRKEGLKDLYDERKNIKEKFLDDIEKVYYSIFNIDKNLINFAKKYGIQSGITLNIDKDYLVKEDIYGTFSPNNTYEWDYFVKDQSHYENTEKYLPFYNSLSYQSIDIGNDINTSFTQFIRKKYKEVLRNNLVMTNERSEIAKKIYLDFKAILDLCITDVDINEHFQIPEITKYFEKRFGKKLSTELSTVNKEKIDFIKNYLNSIDTK